MKTKEQIFQLIHDADMQLKANNRIQVKILLAEIHTAVENLEIIKNSKTNNNNAEILGIVISQK